MFVRYYLELPLPFEQVESAVLRSPEDWVPGLLYVPLAKISGIFAILALFSSWGKSKRKLQHLPREGRYLLVLICLLFASALFSQTF